jgi:hypothetical protein
MAVVEPPLADEDGGVEEEDESDDESDSDDDDDVKLVFTGQTGRALDLRYVLLGSLVLLGKAPLQCFD